MSTALDNLLEYQLNFVLIRLNLKTTAYHHYDNVQCIYESAQYTEYVENMIKWRYLRRNAIQLTIDLLRLHSTNLSQLWMAAADTR